MNFGTINHNFFVTLNIGWYKKTHLTIKLIIINILCIKIVSIYNVNCNKLKLFVTTEDKTIKV